MRRVWKRLFMKIVLWLLIVGLAFFAFLGALAAWEVFQKERKVMAELNRVVESKQDLEERKAALEETLNALGTNRGIEEEVRKKFPLAKPGEEVIVLLDAKDGSVDTSSSSRQSIWQSFWGLFSR